MPRITKMKTYVNDLIFRTFDTQIDLTIIKMLENRPWEITRTFVRRLHYQSIRNIIPRFKLNEYI